MEVVEEQGLKCAVILQALVRCEVCGSQIPVVVLRGFMLLLQDGKDAEGGRGSVGIWRIFLTQGLP